MCLCVDSYSNAVSSHNDLEASAVLLDTEVCEPMDIYERGLYSAKKGVLSAAQNALFCCTGVVVCCTGELFCITGVMFCITRDVFCCRGK